MFPKMHLPRRLEKTRNGFYVDINDIAWPSGAAGLWTNQLTPDGKLKDLSGNGNHGTINGATMIPGPWGDCLQFDRVDDYIDLGSSFNTHPIISVICVLKSYGIGPDAYSDRTLFSFNHATPLVNFERYVLNEPLIQLYNSKYVYYLSTAPNNINDGKFHLFDVSMGAELSDCNFIVDGVLQSIDHANDEGDAATKNGSLMFGFQLASAVSAIAIYPRFLTSTERTSIYTQLFGEWS